MRALVGDSVAETCVEQFDYADRSTSWVTDPAIGPRLGKEMSQLSALSTAQGGSGKLFVVAHSMGGLALRCALDVACSGQEGLGEAVAGVVTFGTPHLGTFWKGRGRSWLANAGGASAGSACRVLTDFGAVPAGSSDAKIIQPICDFIRALLTSDAGRAFTPGSRQLKGLRPLTSAGDFPVLALASRVPLVVPPADNILGRALQTFSLAGTIGTLGDLVVDETSALAESRETEPGLGGTRVVPGGALSTWHGKQTSNPTFASYAAGFISTIATTRLDSPAVDLTSRGVDLDLPSSPLTPAQIRSVVGRWRGQVTEPGVKPYSAEVGLRDSGRGVTGRVVYPELSCLGTWGAARTSGGTVLVDESITEDDSGTCVPEVVVRLRPLRRGGLAYTAIVDGQVHAWAILTRVP